MGAVQPGGDFGLPVGPAITVAIPQDDDPPGAAFGNIDIAALPDRQIPRVVQASGETDRLKPLRHRQRRAQGPVDFQR